MLSGTGSALMTVGAAQLIGAVPDDADMVEIPKAAHGDEVIRYKEVPKKFWNHLKNLRVRAAKLEGTVQGAIGVGKRPTKDTIAGRKKARVGGLLP